ncbi:MAG TPA: hypothetical protein VGM74_22600 [Burkholderiaceae bacterium]|jgi:hypothetical protein
MSPSKVERAGRCALAIGVVTLLPACMVLPRTVQIADRDCQLMARHVVLEETQVAAIGGCANQGCVALIVAAGVVTAATAVVSGTIYIVGNAAYWLERQARCEPPRPQPEIDALMPTPAP